MEIFIWRDGLKSESSAYISSCTQHTRDDMIMYFLRQNVVQFVNYLMVCPAQMFILLINVRENAVDVFLSQTQCDIQVTMVIYRYVIYEHPWLRNRNSPFMIITVT